MWAKRHMYVHEAVEAHCVLKRMNKNQQKSQITQQKNWVVQYLFLLHYSLINTHCKLQVLTWRRDWMRQSHRLFFIRLWRKLWLISLVAQWVQSKLEIMNNCISSASGFRHTYHLRPTPEGWYNNVQHAFRNILVHTCSENHSGCEPGCG